MAETKVKYLDNTGLGHLWSIIKNNFATKKELATKLDASTYTADKTAFDAKYAQDMAAKLDASTYTADKTAFDAKYATSLDIIADGDEVAIALRNTNGDIIPLGENGAAGAAVVIPVATTDDAGLMSSADKATLDAVSTTYVTVDNFLEKEEVTAKALTDLDTRIKALDGDISEEFTKIATYSIKSVDPSSTNVREEYRLTSTVDGTESFVGDAIKIYKDSSLKDVKLEDQNLTFTYILADGSEKSESVDVSTFLAESEFKNGLTVSDAGEVSVLVDAASEKDAEGNAFLSVSEAGVKIDGIKAEITRQINAIPEVVIPDVTASGDDYVAASAEGHAVTITATDTLKNAVTTANSAVQGVTLVASDHVSGTVTKGDDNKLTITLTDDINTTLTDYVKFGDLETLSNDEIDSICTFDEE